MTENEAKREETVQTDNVVFIGRKPVMNYVTACITFFNSGEKQVIVKARGKFISRAADIAEVASKRFLEGQIDIKDIALIAKNFGWIMDP